MTLQQPADISFANIAKAMKSVDPNVLSVFPLLEGARGKVILAVWPPKTSQECLHQSSEEEYAVVLAGLITDEDGTKHGPGALWLRPGGHVHHPRSGPEGAQVLLWRSTPLE
ncbi:hypothetical protein [Streptomyces sp. NPDC058371]|uniref:hypothetical protein n=1 Tax=Streptomyces sp. NPDC058371 TaxID=3346463 RepID=UPI003663E0AF